MGLSNPRKGPLIHLKKGSRNRGAPPHRSLVTRRGIAPRDPDIHSITLPPPKLVSMRAHVELGHAHGVVVIDTVVSWGIEEFGNKVDGACSHAHVVDRSVDPSAARRPQLPVLSQ